MTKVTVVKANENTNKSVAYGLTAMVALSLVLGSMSGKFSTGSVSPESDRLSANLAATAARLSGENETQACHDIKREYKEVSGRFFPGGRLKELTIEAQANGCKWAQ